MRYRFTTWAAVLASALLTACERNIAVDYAPGPVAEWGAYGAAPGGGHYSPADQLTRDNVRLRRQLERAELIIDAQKKLCVALGLPTSDDRTEEER